jgi:hypothetical protein
MFVQANYLEYRGGAHALFRLRVICQIAYEKLRADIKARVDALVTIAPKFRSFADGCASLDMIRQNV